MPIEMSCPSCGARLRLPDDAAGRQAQCPKCQTTFSAGTSSASNQPDPATTAPADRWTVKLSNGQSYGPVSKKQLDTWVSEGRVTGDCQLSREGQEGWFWARDVYPVLASPHGRPTQAYPGQPFAGPAELEFADPTPQSSPYVGNPATSANPYSSPTSASPSYVGARNRYWKPHRGGVILTLGILGLMIWCTFLGIPAWIMGSGDLKEMRAGRMDPSGQGLTQVGMILGIVATVLLVIPLAIAMIAMLLGAARH